MSPKIIAVNVTRIMSAFVVCAVMLSCYAHTPAIKAPAGIASLEKVRLGGVEQWILIRGAQRSNPVLLFVHGGPGSAEMPLEHEFGPELEKHFVVVMWDQRNAGKSLSFSRPVPKESMKVDQFVSDALELTEILRGRLGVDKIYLMGHSWGSVIGVLSAQRNPELYYAYVGIGQVVDLPRNEEISYQFVLEEAKKRKNKLALRQLEKIGPPPYRNIADLAVQRNWLDKFGGAVHNGSMGKFLMAGLDAKEYSALDFVKFAYGSAASTGMMWDKLQGIDFIKQAPRLMVPVYFFEGRHDYNTPWELVQEYYDKLDAPQGKSLVWFENSAHSPNLEEPERFAEVMVSQVLKETYPGGK